MQTINGIPVPDDTDLLAQSAAAMRGMAGKLQCVAGGVATAVLTSTIAANIAFTFPVGRFTAPPFLTATTMGQSNYYAYAITVSATGATIGARNYKDTSASTSIPVHWTAIGA